MLGPVSSHTAAEIRQVVASLGNQPTVAGHSGDHPPELETLRATPARPHQILIQGIMCAPPSRSERRLVMRTTDQELDATANSSHSPGTPLRT
jgi:hypothetical protein